MLKYFVINYLHMSKITTWGVHTDPCFIWQIWIVISTLMCGQWDEWATLKWQAT